MSIRIIYLVGSLDVGGAERQLVELVKGLDKTQFEPVVFTLGTPDANVLAPELEALGIAVKPLGLVRRGAPIWHPLAWWNVGNNLLRLFSLGRIFKAERAQIFHGYLFWAYVFGGRAAHAAGVPVIITSRRSLSSGKTTTWGRHHQWLEDRVNRITDHVVTNSKAVHDDTIEQEGTPRDQISIIYNGVFQAHEALSEDERNTALAQWKRAPDELLIVIVANLIRYKGHRYLLDAIATLKERTAQPFRLIMIGGDGNARAELDEQVRALNVQDVAIFAGSIPRAQRLLPIFDLSILASLEEGFSNTVLESMAAGLPMVATAVGGNPEAVVEGETGFLTPGKGAGALADRIQQLLEDPALRRRMGQVGQARVRQEFSVDTMVQKTESLYREICTRKGL
jgi:glycosyltransferase involved in cell wall biosynthesis